jgi:Ca2+-binding EF-hand superfamily protein
MLWTDRNGDGKIDFEEFKHIVGDNLGKLMTLEAV